MKRIHFNDEMKSRIISEHVAGQMTRGGRNSLEQKYCVNQVALCFVHIVDNSNRYQSAFNADERLATLFDENYQKKWTPEQMLEFVETRGKSVKTKQ